MRNRIVVAVVIIGLVIGAGAILTYRYLHDPNRAVPLVYSNNAMLLELWNHYKTDNIETSSHRTLDRTAKGVTTSEGQSYTMLRAVWMDDKTTFDQSWQFSKNNLQRPSDKLLSWKFGERSDGSYGVLTEIGGENTASDADADTALALMMAYSRWNQADYLYQAREIIQSIWTEEVVDVAGKPVLTADNLEKDSADTVVVNPSYFAPYSFKLFAKVDPDHDWAGLTANSYALLTSLSQDKLGAARSSGLPPNWITINRETGALIPNAATNLDTGYGYDALRIPFRLALDYQWNKDPRAKAVLQNFSFLQTSWQKTGSLKAVYNHDGSIASDYETAAMYGGAIGYFNVVQPLTAKAVYQKKLQALYNPDTQQAARKLSYYDDNWAWFGLALTQDALPNLAEMNN